MRCVEFESRLNDVLDQRRWLESDPALSAHARQCPPCGALAASYEAMIAGLEQAQIPVASAELPARILAALPSPAIESRLRAATRSAPADRHRNRPAAPGPWRLAHLLRPAVGLAAAAALLGCYLAWRGPQPDDDARRLDTRPIAADAAGPVAADAVMPVRRPEPIPSSRLAAASPYRELADDTADSLATALQLFPGVNRTLGDSSDDGGAEPTAAWMHGVSDGLKPVTQTTAGAMNSFFELLAGGKGSRS